MSRLLAIDPGTTESAWVDFDAASGLPRRWAKEPNELVLDRVACYARYFGGRDRLVVEMVASYGKPVGAEVFRTCVWIGRFVEAWSRLRGCPGDKPVVLIERPDVKLHLCGSRNRVTDAVIRQRLIDIYGPGREVAVGRKATPGPLYGMKADCWQALALAITAEASECKQASV